MEADWSSSELQETSAELSLRTGLEPEFTQLDDSQGDDRSGYEPELGGLLQQKAVYVDESTCIGCRYCSHVARNTFYIEPDYGRSRVIRQDGDCEELIQEAIDTCPVDCIHWVSYQELKQLEEERRYQVLQTVGLPMDTSIAVVNRRRAALKLREQNNQD